MSALMPDKKWSNAKEEGIGKQGETGDTSHILGEGGGAGELDLAADGFHQAGDDLHCYS